LRVASRAATAARGFALVFAIWFSAAVVAQERQSATQAAYLGFDANEYPGDALLPQFKRTFAFAGYWLNNPPGASAKDAAKLHLWLGHRAVLAGQGFGFLVLFNGRLERELKSAANAKALGASDARAAAGAAQTEGFKRSTVIFVDQEEGGSMNDAQMAYLLAWFDGVAAGGFGPGIYCSGMPANEGHGKFTITANYVREHAGPRDLVYFVYNDACPPAPGCVVSDTAPQPAGGGVPFAAIWQFAQSPRRHEFTRRCAAAYNADGYCYAPGMGHGSPFIDIESATSPDPSHGRG
jgi:Domain of unknown function (DUF1906)